MSSRFFIAILLLSAGFVGCTDTTVSRKKVEDFKAEGQTVEGPTRDTYLSGADFCSYYLSITSREYGRFIYVPKDYGQPLGELVKIYTWTKRPFNSDKPSMVYVNGGPGQNSHSFDTMTDESWNEIYIDQRGLGCSSPATYDLYRDHHQYSTTNVILDMEEVRKSYGISKWSVYGVSYGTIPSTRYASQFPQFTTAVVLEGTAFDKSDLHSTDWKVEKLNAALGYLTWKKRIGFKKLHKEYSDVVDYVIDYIFYASAGYRRFFGFLDSVIIDEENLNTKRLEKIRISLQGDKARFSRPQKPGGIDSMVHASIFCKELGFGDKEYSFPSYDEAQAQFKTNSISTLYMKFHCVKHGVKEEDLNPYIASNYPIKVPVTYFQGSHDSATLARGAFKHWKTVPQGSVNFLLSQKGGHNPNGSVVRDGDELKITETHIETENRTSIRNTQRVLFYTALRGEQITQAQVNKANQFLEEGHRWLLFQKVTDTQIDSAEAETGGISESISSLSL